MYEKHLYQNAGRFIDPHTMVWTRLLDAPVARVWEAVSTKQGLDAWWLCPVEIDLRPGGKFSHHWEDTIADLKEPEFIDFGRDPSGGAFMRFELRAEGGGTIFSFIDTWGKDAVVVPENSQLPASAGAIDTVQPGGPGTPWSGVAGGWHNTIDHLEAYISGKDIDRSNADWAERCRFYAVYLAEHFRWLELVSSTP